MGAKSDLTAVQTLKFGGQGGQVLLEEVSQFGLDRFPAWLLVEVGRRTWLNLAKIITDASAFRLA